MLLIGSILLLGPVLLLPETMPRELSLALLVLSSVTGMLAVIVFLLAARRAVGGRVRGALARLPRTLLLGVGMSLNNAAAVLEAFLPARGGWERTPKDGIRSRRDARPRARYRSRGGTGAGEAALAAYLAALTVLAIDRGRWGRGAVPRLPGAGVRLCRGTVLAGTLGADLTRTGQRMRRGRRILRVFAAASGNRDDGPGVRQDRTRRRVRRSKVPCVSRARLPREHAPSFGVRVDPPRLQWGTFSFPRAAYSRTIFGLLLPLSALRVSTTARTCASSRS